MVTATATDKPVEDQSQRTETLRVFANPDGTWTADVAAAPVRVQDKDGEWHVIDTTLVARDGGLAPAYSTSDVVFSDGGDKTLATMTETDRDLAWKTTSTLPAPVVNGSTATYPGAAAGGGDLVLTATPTGFEQSIVLHQAPISDLSLVTPVTTDGAKITETPQGGLRIIAEGDTLVTAPAPAMWDSSTDASGSPDNTAPVDTTVTTSGTTTRVTLRPDQDFLTDPGTVYPVTVDPTYSTDVSADSYITNASGTQVSQESSTQLWVGTNDGGTTKARTLIRWATQPWIGQDIVSASLRLQNFYSTNCTAATIVARRITSSWRADTVTWGNQPSVSATDQAGYSPAYGASGCAANEASWNVTNMVAHAADGTAPMQGIQLSGYDETNSYTWRKYRSSETNYAPRMVVTYNQRPGTPAKPVVTPGNAGYATTGRPTFTSTISDADGSSKAVFYVYNSGGTQVWTGATSTLTGASAKATITIPTSASVLADGTYTVKSRGYDGRLYSNAYSSATSFTVDTAKPSALVAATGFTNGSWNDNPPTSSTFTFNGPNDTAAFTWTLDGVAQKALTANSSGDATTTWSVQNGSHTIKVTPTDKAGSAGAAAILGFGAGRPQFVTPDDQQEAARVFTLKASGAPNATGASLSWRYAGETTWNAATGVKTASGTAWSGGVANAADSSASTTGALSWDATQQNDPASNTDPAQQSTLNAPSLLELQVCFTYTGSVQSCSLARQVQLLSGFDGNMPTTSLGPVHVALYTGEASYSDADGGDTQAGIGRSFSSYSSTTTGDGGVFGPGWADDTLSSADTSSDLIDNRTQDGTLVLIETGNASQVFSPATPGSSTYQPAGVDDGSRIALSGPTGNPDTATLTRPHTATTVWIRDASNWTLATGNTPTSNTDYTTSNAGQVTWIAETNPGASPTCTATTQDAKCRGLKVTYTTVNGSARATQIDRLAHGADPLTVASYTYDSNGRLTQACGADPGPATDQNPLCTSYTYTTLNGRTLLASATPPGQVAWRLGYDTQGRLITVKRTLDGNTNIGTGDASWTVQYGISPTATGLPDLSASTASQWGQIDAPTQAMAVFGPSDSTSQIRDADLWYTDDAGVATNTATYGAGQWLIDTSWYDEHGNTVQYLDGAGRSRALSATFDQRPAAASQASTITVYSADGGRVEDEYGVTHEATLKNGTSGPYRQHTSYTYDDENPSLAPGRPTPEAGDPPLNMVVQEIHETAAPDGSADFDPTVVRYEYTPNVTGDGDGWLLGTPTRTLTKLADASWSTEVTRYDQQGRTFETRRPGGVATAAGVGNDAHSTVTSYWSSGANDPDCDATNHADWAGLVCKTGPAAQPAGTPIPTTYYSAYNSNLQPTSIIQSSGTVTRVSKTTYDALDRLTSTHITVTGDTPSNPSMPTTTTTYGADGQATVIQAGTDTVIKSYDTWGRAWNYTDASRTTSTSTYTADGSPATFNDGQGVYSYGYNGGTGSTEEHRGLVTSVSVTGSGMTTKPFTMVYDLAGTASKLTYPNGLTSTWTRDEAGYPTGLYYSDGSNAPFMQFTADVDAWGRQTAVTSPGSSQDYEYDALGRLERVNDERDGGCTVRTYGFNPSSNRTSRVVYGPANGDGACQSTTASQSATTTFDSAGRATNTGYTYDLLGRTTGLPQTPTTGAVSATYFPNDKAASITQAVPDGSGGTLASKTDYTLDPASRVSSTVQTLGGTDTARATFRFSDDTDSPTSIRTSSDGGANWTTTRYVTVPSLGMAATVTGGAMDYQLPNLHGDVVATQTDATGNTVISSYCESDEYGNSLKSSNAFRYGWLGAHQRDAASPTGILLMGARAYNPATGLFLTPDPVTNGGANNYGYPTDPINMSDLDGSMWKWVWNTGWTTANLVFTGFCAGAATFFYICRAAVSGTIAGLKYITYHKYVAEDYWDYPNAAAHAILGAITSIPGSTLPGATVGSVVKWWVKTACTKVWWALKSLGWKAAAATVYTFYVAFLQEWKNND